MSGLTDKVVELKAADPGQILEAGWVGVHGTPLVQSPQDDSSRTSRPAGPVDTYRQQQPGCSAGTDHAAVPTAGGGLMNRAHVAQEAAEERRRGGRPPGVEPAGLARVPTLLQEQRREGVDRIPKFAEAQGGVS